MRTSIRSITLFAALLSACAATPALAQTKDQKHQAAELTAIDSAGSAVATAARLDSTANVAYQRFCATKTGQTTKYMVDACALAVQVRAQFVIAKRTLARADSNERAFAVAYVPPAPTPTPIPEPVPTPAPSPVPPTSADSAPTTTIPPPSTAPPSMAQFSHGSLAAPLNGAQLASFPRESVTVAWPAIARRVAATPTTLQAALDTAKDGDAIELPAGSRFSGQLTAKNTPHTSWITIRTAIPDDGDIWKRMTQARADSLNLATITSPTGEAIWFNSGAHHIRLSMLRVATDATASNAVVRAANGETSAALLPHHLAIDRSIVDARNADVGRCVYADAAYVSITSSTLDNCHSKVRDSQGIEALNGTGPFRVENNKIVASHQYVMSGGGDPSIPGLIPSDWVIRRNWMTKPLSWKSSTQGVYTATQWQGKTALESKNFGYALVEGNVVENVWPDAQDGFCDLRKSVNQGKQAPWSQTHDVTVRYNRFRNCANGFNLAANPEGAATPMTRVAIYDNVIEPFSYQDGTNGKAFQFGGALSHIIVLHNSFASAGLSAIVFADNVLSTSVVSGNLLPEGQYGMKGGGASEGAGSWTAYTSNSLFQGNAIIGPNCSGVYPATTLCLSRIPAALPLALDGRAVGADTAKVNALTAGVVVP